MRIEAHVRNAGPTHSVEVSTEGRSRVVALPPREGAPGSSVNGGELLCAAIATCYCNDLYREAGKLGIAVERVEVAVFADFGGVGEAARSIRYAATVAARASEAAIRELVLHTDRVAEVHNTLRLGIPVTLDALHVEAIA
jgi:organic hydroperoxide reductase OsmC/OhrA